MPPPSPLNISELTPAPPGLLGFLCVVGIVAVVAIIAVYRTSRVVAPMVQEFVVCDRLSSSVSPDPCVQPNTLAIPVTCVSSPTETNECKPQPQRQPHLACDQCGKGPFTSMFQLEEHRRSKAHKNRVQKALCVGCPKLGRAVRPGRETKRVICKLGMGAPRLAKGPREGDRENFASRRTQT